MYMKNYLLKSLDFLVFINFIVCGKYEIIVHIDTIPNKIFPTITTSTPISSFLIFQINPCIFYQHSNN